MNTTTASRFAAVISGVPPLGASRQAAWVAVQSSAGASGEVMPMSFANAAADWARKAGLGAFQPNRPIKSPAGVAMRLACPEIPSCFDASVSSRVSRAS